VGLTWIGLLVYGLNGSGMAFFASYLAYFAGIYFIVRRLCGFRLSVANRRLVLLQVPLITIVFLSWYYLPHVAAGALGAVIALASGIFSLKTICTLIPLARLPGAAQKIIVFFRLAPANPGI
jgi:PST family polysaccharide transporter